MNCKRALIEETDLGAVEADSAEEALHYLERHASAVALLMTRIRLPYLMDGVELARRVSLRWPWIRVIVTSDSPGDRPNDLPRTAIHMREPWRALDVLIEVGRAGG